MRIQDKLLRIAYEDPEQWVAQVTYIDQRGTVTDRTISPLAYLTSDTVRVYCLGREQVRTFKLKRILRVRLRFASEVLCPEAIKDLVKHKNRLRLDKSTDTTAKAPETGHHPD